MHSMRNGNKALTDKVYEMLSNTPGFCEDGGVESALYKIEHDVSLQDGLRGLASKLGTKTKYGDYGLWSSHGYMLERHELVLQRSKHKHAPSLYMGIHDKAKIMPVYLREWKIDGDIMSWQDEWCCNNNKIVRCDTCYRIQESEGHTGYKLRDLKLFNGAPAQTFLDALEKEIIRLSGGKQ
ncbi:hypothetical protein HY642_01170 [Candidatus Woesearchaeota archaeon]|nr:hypothetical protein [Candidatus Woesearchaeota archaeon]